MLITERVAVARFKKPIKLSFRRRPEHEIERDLTGKFSVTAGLGISQVGEAINKGETIRYYKRIGLLPQPKPVSLMDRAFGRRGSIALAGIEASP